MNFSKKTRFKLPVDWDEVMKTETTTEPTTTTPGPIAKADLPEWSDWVATGTCSVECGLGTMPRTRSCVIKNPAAGGTCAGSDSDLVECVGNGECTDPGMKAREVS